MEKTSNEKALYACTRLSILFYLAQKTGEHIIIMISHNMLCAGNVTSSSLYYPAKEIL